jgi:enoyl-CoA hydratase
MADRSDTSDTSDTSGQPHLLSERRGHTLILTMNRPEAKNALSAEMTQLLGEAWDEVNANDDIRVVILTGAGGVFCAGADLKAMNSSHPGDHFKGEPGGEKPDMTVMKPLLKGFYLTKPLIAAVEGPAIAGGTEILTATDIRVAGESARFGVAEVRWGLFPLGGSVVRLPRQIPATIAAEMVLSARQYSAQEAKEIGLIGHVVPDGQALDKALEIADRISANGPLAVQAVLRTLRETACLPEPEAFKIEAEIGTKVFMTNDAKEGPMAFAEKRTPNFTAT